MLAKRVILILPFVDGVLFRTKRFVPDYRYTQAFSWSGDADELVFLDITRHRTAESRLKFLKILEKYGRDVDIPMYSGGGIRSFSDAVENINAGGEGIVVGYGGARIYEEIAAKIGCQALIAGIDYTKDGVSIDQGRCAPGETVEQAAAEAIRLGAGQVLLTSIDRDGSLSGFDCQAIGAYRQRFTVPLIIAGGCGSWGHFKEAFEAGADGAATSNIFHLNPTAVRACKTYLRDHGCNVRP